MKKRLVTKEQIRSQLMELITLHNRFSTTDECYAWGARSANDFAALCVDGCDEPPTLLFVGGEAPNGPRCWRCAFWRHLATCPQREKLAREKLTLASA